MKSQIAPAPRDHLNARERGSLAAAQRPEARRTGDGVVAPSDGSRRPTGTRRVAAFGQCADRQVVSLVDADPELFARVSAADLPLVRRGAVARVIQLAAGHAPCWSEQRPDAQEDWLGLFVLDGTLVRRVRINGHSAADLFGTGDVLRPWDEDDDIYDPLRVSVDWVVLTEARLAVLDDAFAARIASWPSIGTRIAGRAIDRARELALTQAVSHLPRADDRLLLMFWLLAQRWGRVGPDGVRVRLPFTHELLAAFIGARRPTVSIAAGELSRARLLIREAPDCWLLSNWGIDRLQAPRSSPQAVEGNVGASNGASPQA